ncbi:hypothetical protein NSTCB13_05234 [Nostoc sp. DSM 114160]|jgi:hypothetical protein
MSQFEGVERIKLRIDCLTEEAEGQGEQEKVSKPWSEAEHGYQAIGVKLRKMDGCQEWANQW